MTFRFDVSKLTLRQVLEFNRANQGGDVEAVAVYLAQACIECPPELGDPKAPTTFTEADYGVYVDAGAEFEKATAAAAKEAGTGEFAIKANFRHIKAKDVGKRLLKPMASGDLESVVKFLTEVMTECPKAWGKPNDPETYMGLPHYSVFLPLIRQVGEESRNPKK